MPSTDLFRTGYENIVVDVEDRSGTKTGDGPILTALYLEYNEPLSRIGSFRFAMPANDKRINNITLKKSVLRFWIDGVQEFLGVPERKHESIDSSGVVQVEFTGRSLAVELAEQATTPRDFDSATNAPDLCVGFASPSWSLDAVNGFSTTATAVYLKTTTESCFATMLQVAEKINEDFIYDPTLSAADRKIIWLRTTRADSGIRAIQSLGNLGDSDQNPNVCFIQSLTLINDSAETANRIYVYGSGQGESRLDLRPADNRTATINLVSEDGSDVTVQCTQTHNLAVDDWVQIHETTNYQGVHQIDLPYATISAISGDGATATVTTITNPHPYSAGQWVTLSGTTYYDGTYVILTTPAANSFTFASTTTTASATGEIYSASTFTYAEVRAPNPSEQSGYVDHIVSDRYHLRSLSTSGDKNYIEDWAYHVSGFGSYQGMSGTVNEQWPSLEKTIQFTDITPLSNTDADVNAAADMLVTAGISWLKRYSTPQTFYELTVTKLGTLRPGQTINVIYEDDNHSINATLYVLDIWTSINQDGAKVNTLTVGTTDRWPTSDAGIMVDQMEKSTVFRAHKQLNANSYTTSYRRFVGEDQSDDVAEVRFWFGEEVTQLSSVVYRFRVLPIVNTSLDLAATTTSSGGAISETSGASSASTSDSGGSSTPTTTSGGSSTPTSSSSDPIHSHSIPINDAVPAYDLGYSLSAGVAALRNDGNPGTLYTDSQAGGAMSHTHDVTISGHTHDVTISSHTHGMAHTHSVTAAAHTHSLTPVSRTALVRENSGNTWTIYDLEYRVNSGSWTDLDTATASGNFYYIDVTNDVMTANTFRPVQEDNTIEIRNKQDTVPISSIAGNLTTVTVEFASKTVTDASGDATTATITTSTTHGYKPGWSVTISGTSHFNGDHTILTTPATNTFTIAGVGVYSGESGTCAAHGLSTGNYVVVADVETTTAYNGTWGPITVDDNDTIYYSSTVTGSGTGSPTIRPANTAMLDSFLSVRNIIQSTAYS